jgi:hypothetical protein
VPLDRDPDHPIIDRPFEYEIVELCYHHDPDDGRNTYLDLTLRRGTTIRRLRFLQPRDLEIEKGFPRPTGGLCILDVRHRQWDGINVRVADFEASWGKLAFWARDVFDLDETGHRENGSEMESGTLPFP